MSQNIEQQIVLRPLNIKEAGRLAELANNRKIFNNVRDIFPSPYLEENAVEFIKYCNTEDPSVTFGIEYEGNLTGVIGLILQTDIYRKTAEIGYWLGEDFWGKGIATQALRLMIDYAFKKLDLVRLHTGVFDSNKASMSVLEKCGFKQEGIFEKSVIKNDVLLDEYRYGLVNPKYLQSK